MNTKKLLAKIAAIATLLGSLLLPYGVEATSPLTARSATVSTSAGAATGVSYSVKFTLGTSGQTLGSVLFEICDSPLASASCAGTAGSSGASFGSATFGSVTGLSGSWSSNAGSAGGAGGTSIVFKKASAGVESGTPAATVVINGVTNPTASNTEYYLRISTFSDTGASVPAYPGTDFGAVALDTANQITVSGTMPESLVFCVGTSGSNCTNITGSSVNLGTFSPAATNTGTSLMSASTNAGSGYAITINGTTMTSGANTVAAMGTQTLNSSGCAVSCTSTTGVSQFGSNVRANTVPSVGADVTGSGTATGSGGYNTANSFRFFTGDTVASVGGVTNSNLFTNSYIVNVPGSQAAGLYTATMTYICTATF
jgi:hypothetical protein